MTDQHRDAAAAAHEAARLDALRKLELLDSPPSEGFDRITRLAAQIFDLPIAAVSLTDSDRQWFKSRVGVEHSAIPRLRAPCAEVAGDAELLVIPDLLADPCYRDSHLARSGIRFYAGAPLLTADGFCLGAMCVLGTAPRAITAAERAALRDLAAMVMAQIELQHALGRVDPLSGLPNRTQFMEDFKDLEMDRPRGEQRLAALFILASPEQHSNVLRVVGSSYLDQMVAEAARMLRHSFGAQGKIYHVGATQFVFVAPAGTAQHDFGAALEDWLAARSRALGMRFVTTATAGVASFVLGRDGGFDLLRDLHCAAQDALETGRHVSVYSATQAAVHQRRYALLGAFGAALESPGQLRLVYQPKLELAGGRCVGAEVLLRWRDPLLGEVGPAEFIPIVEHTSMVRATTAWVLEAAMRQLVEWRAAGLELQLAVNVSAANLLEADFGARVIDALARHALPAGCLALELTESAVMQDRKLAQATLESLAAAGIHLAIDDFGTGYSSLSYLQSLPVSEVKIDQSFMRELAGDRRRRALVAAMIALSHELGYRVVAEGVETPEEAALLHGMGCDAAQGYLYARPAEAAQFAHWLRARDRALGAPLPDLGADVDLARDQF